ncbi:hypothetical protein BP00DRAFT_475673, partial [Aspergillus indologenus CBS 114.80]
MAADIADESAFQRAIDKTAEECGRIDIGMDAATLGDSVLATHELGVKEYMGTSRADKMGAW